MSVDPTPVPFALHPACANVSIVDPLTATIKVDPPRKKVAIIGFATNTFHLIPWLDSSWELWGLNQAHLAFTRRADRWFEMHQPEYTEDVRDPNYMEFLRTCPIPVYMLDHRPDVPSSVRFPIEAAIQTAGRDYFTSSIAYMLAIAIMEGFEEIALYGVNLAIGDEYFYQKACAEWWIGLAEGKGISVYVPKASALLKQWNRYGYHPESVPGLLTKKLLDLRIKNYRTTCEQHLSNYHIHLGALREAEALLQAVEGQEHGADLVIMSAAPTTPMPTT